MELKKAVIPAAGYGTRLYPLTLDKPKALIDIAGKPIIEHLINKIIELGSIDEIIIITNHKFYDNFKNWLNNNPQKIKIQIFDDGTTDNENRLGAIGDVIFGLDQAKINDHILWLSSDNIFNFNLKRMSDLFIEKNKDVIAAYDVKDINEAKKMGVLTADKNGKIIDFEEKPEEPKSTLCSPGYYIFTSDTIKLFNTYVKEGNPPDKPGDFIKWLYKKKDVYIYTYDRPDDKWFDIGTMETLALAEKELS